MCVFDVNGPIWFGAKSVWSKIDWNRFEVYWLSCDHNNVTWGLLNRVRLLKLFIGPNNNCFKFEFNTLWWGKYNVNNLQYRILWIIYNILLTIITICVLDAHYLTLIGHYLLEPRQRRPTQCFNEIMANLRLRGHVTLRGDPKIDIFKSCNFVCS